MAFDAGLVARVADALLALGQLGARQKNVFGGRGFLLGKSTFAIAWHDALLVKTPPADYPALCRAPGVQPFAPDGEHAMGTWLMVNADVIADDPELAEWLRTGLRSLGR